MIKRSLVTTLFLGTMLTTSLEAASPSSNRNPKFCPCPKAFQGFYLGGSAGYGIGSVRTNNVYNVSGVGSASKAKPSVQGFDGGLLLGYTYIFSNKVGLGAEAYFNWSSTAGSTSSYNAGGTNPLFVNIALKNALQLRIPVSYVIGDLVAPKLMIGWDNSLWTETANYNNGQIAVKNTSRYNGILWGAGVDFLVAKQVVSGLEYVGVVSQNKTFPNTVGGVTDYYSVRPIYNTFKATIKVLF